MGAAETTIIIIIMIVLVLYILEFSGLADLIKKSLGCLTNPKASFLCVVIDTALALVGAKQLSSIVKDIRGKGGSSDKGKGGDDDAKGKGKGGDDDPDIDPRFPEV